MALKSLYLTEKALPLIERYHDKFVVNGLHPDNNDILFIRNNLLHGDWRNFDNVYVGFYVLNLIHDKIRSKGFENSSLLSISNIDSTLMNEEPRNQVVRSDFILDIDIAPTDARYGLIDEHAVLSIMNFKADLEDCLRFDSKLGYVDVGCVFFSFLVVVPNVVERAKFDEVENILDVGISAVKTRLASDRWKQLAKSYHVVNEQFSLWSE